MKRAWLKWLVASVLVIGILIYGFAFVLYEGNVVVITRFGAPRIVIEDAGIHFKLPWPFEKVYTFDKRYQYTDSTYIEALTKDKKNVILQSYTIWSIADSLKYLQSTSGNQVTAEINLNSLITNAKNAVMGKYDLNNMVSTNPDELMLDAIQADIMNAVHDQAYNLYGIEVSQIGFKRLGLPEVNTIAAFEQMRAERMKHVTQLQAEGQRDAAIIRNEADVKVAMLIAEGMEESAKIKGEAELEAARVYADAQKSNPTFYSFLRKLDSLEKILGQNSTLIFKTDSAPFDALSGR